MAVYESRYAELAFYVNGELRKFQYGKYKTDDPKEIEILDKLADVKRVDADELKQTKPAEEPKASEVNESKPKAKKPSAK